MKRKTVRSTTSLLNEKPLQPHPGARRVEYRESRCNACCKSPYGCARNFVCPCHRTPKETRS
ncbi:hypothetical protein ACF1AJ_20580 [Leifsonia sp. NPDC014704]|uniref:hypothetical protein n=1 Tax=Leifsonia sp. NPDC014704 TaxID=3364123 RepID=UPI0036F4732E